MFVQRLRQQHGPIKKSKYGNSRNLGRIRYRFRLTKGQSSRTSAKRCSINLLLVGYGTPCLYHLHTRQAVAHRKPLLSVYGLALRNELCAIPLEQSHAYLRLRNRNTQRKERAVAPIVCLIKHQKVFSASLLLHQQRPNRGSGLPGDSERVHSFCSYKVLSRFSGMQEAIYVCVATRAPGCQAFRT
jgi:hypothetical protein